MRRDTSIGTNFEPVWIAFHYSRLLKENLITKEQAVMYKKRAIRDNKSFQIE